VVAVSFCLAPALLLPSSCTFIAYAFTKKKRKARQAAKHSLHK